MKSQTKISVFLCSALFCLEGTLALWPIPGVPTGMPKIPPGAWSIPFGRLDGQPDRSDEATEFNTVMSTVISKSTNSPILFFS